MAIRTLAFCLLLLPTLVEPSAAQRRGDCRGAKATGWQGSMVPPGEPGEPMRVSGRVVGPNGEAMAGVEVLAYQTDSTGHYSRSGADEANARLCAVVSTNDDGRYSLTTIRPAAYPGGRVPEHIHFELWREGIARQRRDLQFADDELVPEHRRFEMTRTSTVRPVERGAGGVWLVERDFEIHP